MSILTVICPNCRSASDCEPANHIRVASKDAKSLSSVKHITLKKTKGWSVWRPYYHAIHYPKISPSLENIKGLPTKYMNARWNQSFHTPDNDEPNCVINCTNCQYLKTHKLDWPADAFFKVEYKNRLLWARDRKMAIKILHYIESIERKKRILSKNDDGTNNYDYIVQDRDLRKIPTHFQSNKARPEISKKLRRVLDLPAQSHC